MPAHSPQSATRTLPAKIMTGCLRLMARMPLRILYIWSDFAFIILYHLVKYRRKVVQANLRHAFPDVSDKQIKGWEHEFYRHFCDVFIEAIKLLHISDKELDRRIEVINAEGVDRNIEAGRSVVLFLGHFGNWEWVTDIVRHFKSDAHTGQIYHPLSDKHFDQVMLAIRSRFDSENIPMNRTVRHLLQIEKSGHHFVVGFIADQRPAERNPQHWTDFMGIPSPIIVGGETIGRRLNAAYMYVDIEKTARGHYRLTFVDIPDETPAAESTAVASDGLADCAPLYPATRHYFDLLEKTIRRQPPYWLWTHRRWSRKRNQ